MQVSLKNLNKLVNHDRKHLNSWLSTNKISLNVEKTEVKNKLSGKRLYSSNLIKYLGIRIGT